MKNVEEIRTHAVREVRQNADEADLLVEEIGSVGYTVIDSGLTADELKLVRQKIDGLYELQVREIGGEEKLLQINDADLVRCIIGYDDYFLKLAAHPAIMEVARRILGDNFILMSQNAIINRPADSHYQFTWHRDLNYQHYVSSRPLAFSALYAVDDFTAETGGTWLIPGSHKVEAFPSEDYVRRHGFQVDAPAGSILLFDAMIYHRAGVNRSGKLRRSVNHIYSVPMIQQQISLPNMLKGKFSDDAFLAMFLGYETATGATVKEWRTRKLVGAGRTAKP